MFSVFNANLLTDMGKTIVRRHLTTTDSQAVWRELSEHMRTSSKGASEMRRLTQYVTNPVLPLFTDSYTPGMYMILYGGYTTSKKLFKSPDSFILFYSQ